MKRGQLTLRLHGKDHYRKMAKARKRFGGGPAMRLPKAIQAILSNYRGTRVSGIPEEAVCAVS